MIAINRFKQISSLIIVILLIGLLGIPQLLACPLSPPSVLGTNSTLPTVGGTVDLLGNLPLTFERNEGQFDDAIKFIAHPRHYQLSLTNQAAILTPYPSSNSSSPLKISLVNANQNSKPMGEQELATRSNYYIGEQKDWKTAISHFAQVRYPEIYPNIDLLYYGNHQQLEYDFILSPGADPQNISLSFSGMERLSLDVDGNLVINIDGQQLLQHKPIIYQPTINQGREIIAGHYKLINEHEVGFVIGNYDTNRELIIDPVITYSTYLGGSGNDQIVGIGSDSSGNIYVLGTSNSSNFPQLNNPAGVCNGCINGVNNIFVTKLNPSGSQILYSTILGGSDIDEATGMVVDAAGNAYLTGRSRFGAFPTTPGAYRTTTVGGFDCFVTKLTTSGTLSYSTYIGSTSDDQAGAIAVDTNGVVYLTGSTSSSNFPITAGALQPTFTVGSEAFFLKLSANGSTLLYSTFIGGNGADVGMAVTVDSSGNAYVAGNTNSTNFPVTSGVVLPFNNSGGSRVFLSKISSAGTLTFSTYFGGTNGGDIPTAIAVDSSGVYVAGYTSSTDFITTLGAFQRSFAGNGDGFVTKFNPTATALLYSTYLGGSSSDQILAMRLDGEGNLYLVGNSFSTNYPFTSGNGHSPSTSNTDAFMTKLNSQGTELIFSMLWGGQGNIDDAAQAISLGSNGDIYVAGVTKSPDFPTLNPLQTSQTNNGANSDGFITKLNSSAGTIAFNTANYRVSENSGNLIVTVTRSSNGDGSVSVDYATSDGTATNPNDYTAVSGTLTFTNGETSKVIVIPITNNSQATCGRAFSVTLSNPTAGAVLGTLSTTTVSIDEDDLP